MQKCRIHNALFAAYSAMMLWLLFHRSMPDTAAPGFSYWGWVAENVNLTPFQTILLFWNVLAEPQSYIDRLGISWYEANRQHAIINLGGNVLMFLPLGFFLPHVFPKLQKLWRTLFCAAVIMACVEVLQVLTLRGNCDVDDLILNLLGTAVGYGLFRLEQKLQKHRLDH